MPDADTFTDLRVFMTGATGGVGEAVLERLLARGARVFATSKSQSKLDAIPSSGELSEARIKVAAADLTEASHIGVLVAEAVEWLGGLDVLINNAGIAYHCAAANVREQEAVEVMLVNAVAPMLITAHALPALRLSPSPKIINISSILGSKPLPLTATYTASKHALNGYSKVLRLEEVGSRISVTTIEPGAIDTAFIWRTHDAEAVERLRARPRQKLSPKEVARWVIAVLESPDGACPELIRVAPIDQAL